MPGKAHLNKANKKKCEKYRADRRLPKNKIKHILNSIKTAGTKQLKYLEERLNFWIKK